MTMAIANLHPNRNEWRYVSHEPHASSWRTMDVSVWHPDLWGYRARELWHYNTLMGVFVHTGRDGFPSLFDSEAMWVYVPLSYGYGSVSDANGIRKIVGHPYQYRRDARGGGPRYVCHGSNVYRVCDGSYLSTCLEYVYGKRYTSRPDIVVLHTDSVGS